MSEKLFRAKSVLTESGKHDGYYVSAEGIVYSDKNPTRPGALKAKKTFKSDNRMYVEMRQSGKRVVIALDRLVAYAFVENPDPKKRTYIRHLDGNTFNNAADNLVWVEPKCKRCTRYNGQCLDGMCVNPVTSDDQRRFEVRRSYIALGEYRVRGNYKRIAEMYISGMSMSEISEEVMVSNMYVSRVLKRIREQNLPPRAIVRFSPPVESLLSKLSRARERLPGASTAQEITLKRELSCILSQLGAYVPFCEEPGLLEQYIADCCAEFEIEPEQTDEIDLVS